MHLRGRHLRRARSEHRFRATGTRRWRYRVLIGAGVVLIAAAGSWQLYATLWSAHSARVGKALVHRFVNENSLGSPKATPKDGTGTATLASCAGASGADAVKGLLEIPKIGLVAPVEQGVEDAQLDVAVGHFPASVWPGDSVNAVLEAHDVSYFVNISKLDAGDPIRYVTPCITYLFTVQSHTVVQEGAPVYNTAAPTITLVTCWPTNALWFTPQRYLVSASLTSSTPTRQPGSYVAGQNAPTVPVPSELAAQGVTLETYSVPMGAMALAGSPDPAWVQSTQPLLVESSAVKAFIAGVRSLTESRTDWWDAIAPGVTPPPSLLGAHNPSYL
ncbi:MAG: class D sortase, partial [Gemmatimonadales bacterium]